MSRSPSSILQPRQAAYLRQLVPARDKLMSRVEELARKEGIEFSGPEVARLLALLIQATAAERILEVGTGIGYGTLALTAASTTARVTSIDRDAALQQTAAQFLEQAGVETRVELLCGEAVDLLRGLHAPYDLYFIDGDPADYRRCLDLGLQLLRVGGVVVANRLLWRGLVADPEGEDDPSIDALRSFNSYLVMYPQLASIVLPLAEGVGLAVKTRPLTTDLGGPF